MMKLLFSLNLALILCVTCFAQKQKTSPDSMDENAPKKQANKKSSVKSDNSAMLQAGTSLEAQLQQTLDVKKSRVGDEVILTTTKAIKQNGATVVAKGSRLIGRVTEVQQKTKTATTSKLGVVFDRIEGKNLSAPISATIVSLTQTSANTSGGDTLDSDISGNSNTAGNVSRSNSGGGGLLGGVSNTVGGAVNTTTNTVGGVTNTVNGTTNGLGKTLNGIQLSQSSSSSVSGATTLSAQTNNLRIEKGVMFQLRLTEAVEK